MIDKLEPGLYAKMKEKLVVHWKTYKQPEKYEQGRLKKPARIDTTQKAPKSDSADESEEDQE